MPQRRSEDNVISTLLDYLVAEYKQRPDSKDLREALKDLVVTARKKQLPEHLAQRVTEAEAYLDHASLDERR